MSHITSMPHSPFALNSHSIVVTTASRQTNAPVLRHLVAYYSTRNNTTQHTCTATEHTCTCTPPSSCWPAQQQPVLRGIGCRGRKFLSAAVHLAVGDSCGKSNRWGLASWPRRSTHCAAGAQATLDAAGAAPGTGSGNRLLRAMAWRRPTSCISHQNPAPSLHIHSLLHAAVCCRNCLCTAFCGVVPPCLTSPTTVVPLRPVA